MRSSTNSQHAPSCIEYMETQCSTAHMSNETGTHSEEQTGAPEGRQCRRRRTTGATQTTHSADRHGSMGEQATHPHPRARPPTVLAMRHRSQKVASSKESNKVINRDPNETPRAQSIGKREVKRRGCITKKDRQNLKQQKIREQNNIKKIENELKKWEKHKCLLGHILQPTSRKQAHI